MLGVFDSGFGGLTILKELIKKLPQYNYVYLGDNARAPYGNKSEATVYDYTREAVDFLFKQGCQLIILACNTASAEALRRIQQEWLPENWPGKRVLGVIIPVAQVAAGQSRSKKIGVIGTKLTIQSGAYGKELNKIRPGLKVFAKATPLLVPLVENNWAGEPETRMILRKYLSPLKDKKIDTLILGCTHYPFLKHDIADIMGKKIKIVSTPSAVAYKLGDYLLRHPEIENKLKRESKRKFYTTDELAQFKKFGEKYLSLSIKNIKKVDF